MLAHSCAFDFNTVLVGPAGLLKRAIELVLFVGMGSVVLPVGVEIRRPSSRSGILDGAANRTGVSFQNSHECIISIQRDLCPERFHHADHECRGPTTPKSIISRALVPGCGVMHNVDP